MSSTSNASLPLGSTFTFTHLAPALLAMRTIAAAGHTTPLVPTATKYSVLTSASFACVTTSAGSISLKSTTWGRRGVPHSQKPAPVRKPVLAAVAPILLEGPVDLEHVLAAGALVKAVDVLCDQRERRPAQARSFGSGQRNVRGVWLSRPRSFPHFLQEREHARRVLRPSFRCHHVLNVEVVPYSARPTEGSEPARDRDCRRQ